MALKDPIDDVDMSDDTGTATIEIEWSWWNKPSQHWPGFTRWQVLRWAKRTRPWAMNMQFSIV